MKFQKVFGICPIREQDDMYNSKLLTNETPESHVLRKIVHLLTTVHFTDFQPNQKQV